MSKTIWVVCFVLLCFGGASPGFAQSEPNSVASGLQLAFNGGDTSLAALGGSFAAKPGRSLTFTNQCPFDVWLKSTGSNASNIACSPNKTSAQANCPDNFVCYEENANTTYCVAGTAKTTVFPIQKKTDIALNAATCKSGQQITDTSSNLWGQCTCAANTDCAANQLCQQVVPGTSQCYWGYTLPKGGKIAKGGSATLDISINNSQKNAIIAGGKFYAKLACDDNGNCLSDNTKGAPATLIEYTFQNDNDWYDVSYINGVNLPATMYPVPAKNLGYDANDPYRCMAAGGDTGTIEVIETFQKNNGIKGNGTLNPFACDNDYATQYTGALNGFNFVSEETPVTACSKQSDCASGLTCGLTLSSVQNSQSGTTCGNRLGYWTYAQLCAANSQYNNSGLGIACDTLKTDAYALCRNQAALGDQGPGRSCFNANTTKKGDTCCGYAEWTKNVGGKVLAQPLGKGDAPVAGVVTSYWTTNILPTVKRVKQGCYLAYSYQYDDPFSTFTCASSGMPNETNYNVTLCPGKHSAGINPPAAATCTAKVPSAYKAEDFTASPAKGYTIAIKQCDAKGGCTKAVPPVAGATIFAALAGGGDTYEVTASKASASQACKFTIPRQGCIQRISTTQECMNWSLANDGAWAGRSIASPAF